MPSRKNIFKSKTRTFMNQQFHLKSHITLFSFVIWDPLKNGYYQLTLLNQKVIRTFRPLPVRWLLGLLWYFNNNLRPFLWFCSLMFSDCLSTCYYLFSSCFSILCHFMYNLRADSLRLEDHSFQKTYLSQNEIIK